MVFGEAEGELAVGGVFLRIFIAQPAWVLRKPREFLIALLEKLTELLEKNNPHVSFSHQTACCNTIPTDYAEELAASFSIAATFKFTYAHLFFSMFKSESP